MQKEECRIRKGKWLCRFAPSLPLPYSAFCIRHSVFPPPRPPPRPSPGVPGEGVRGSKRERGGSLRPSPQPSATPADWRDHPSGWTTRSADDTIAPHRPCSGKFRVAAGRRVGIEWYLFKDGERQGPVSPQLLRQLAAGGDVRPADLLWREGLADWVPASRVAGLFPSRPRKSGRISRIKRLPRQRCRTPRRPRRPRRPLRRTRGAGTAGCPCGPGRCSARSAGRSSPGRGSRIRPESARFISGSMGWSGHDLQGTRGDDPHGLLFGARVARPGNRTRPATRWRPAGTCSSRPIRTRSGPATKPSAWSSWSSPTPDRGARIPAPWSPHDVAAAPAQGAAPRRRVAGRPVVRLRVVQAPAPRTPPHVRLLRRPPDPRRAAGAVPRLHLHVGRSRRVGRGAGGGFGAAPGGADAAGVLGTRGDRPGAVPPDAGPPFVQRKPYKITARFLLGAAVPVLWLGAMVFLPPTPAGWALRGLRRRFLGHLAADSTPAVPQDARPLPPLRPRRLSLLRGNRARVAALHEQLRRRAEPDDGEFVAFAACLAGEGGAGGAGRGGRPVGRGRLDPRPFGGGRRRGCPGRRCSPAGRSGNRSASAAGRDRGG